MALPKGLPLYPVDVVSPTTTSPCEPLPLVELADDLLAYYDKLFVLPNWTENAQHYNDVLCLARQHQAYPPELHGICEKCTAFFAFMIEHDLCDIHYKIRGAYPDPPCASCKLLEWKQQFECSLVGHVGAQSTCFTFPTKYGVPAEQFDAKSETLFTLPTKCGVQIKQ